MKYICKYNDIKKIVIPLSKLKTISHMKTFVVLILTVITLSLTVTSCSTSHRGCKGFKAHPDYGRKYK